jgi:hypothetical protein
MYHWKLLRRVAIIDKVPSLLSLSAVHIRDAMQHKGHSSQCRVIVAWRKSLKKVLVDKA